MRKKYLVNTNVITFLKQTDCIYQTSKISHQVTAFVKRYAVFLWLMASIAFSHSSDITQERIWTSKDGKTLRGTFVRLINDGKQVEIFNASRNVVVIALENLSVADRELLLATGSAKKTKPVQQPGDSSAFQDFAALDRKKLPLISQGDFGNKESDCVPSSFCNFLLWWDQEGVLEIPKRGDFEKKAEWIHSRLARYCGTRNTAGTSVSDASKGFTEYFTKDIPELATLKIKIDNDLRPANLARYTSGVNATMLQMTIREPGSGDSGHWVALLSAEEDGTVVFHTWGIRFEGKIEAIGQSPPIVVKIDGQERKFQSEHSTSYEIKITNREDTPEWFRNSRQRFLLLPEASDSIYVLKPYVYKEKGKIANAPLDPSLDPANPS
jgi:hypothetical protein